MNNGVVGNNKIRQILYRGTINKRMRVSYTYKYENGSDYATVRNLETGGYSIIPSYSISISEGFERDNIFIPGNGYWLFVALFHKSLELIQTHLNELYTNMNEDEFDMNGKAVEIFIQEKSLRANGIGIVPDKWVDDNGKCYVALHVDGEYGGVTIPLVDAIGMDCMFMHFDPNTFGLIMLNMLHG